MSNQFESFNNKEKSVSGEVVRSEPANIELQEASNRIKFPHAEEAIKLYEKEYGNNPEEIEKVRDIFNAFLNQEVANTAVYKAEKYNTAFPYTRISSGDLAKTLYKKYAGTKAKIKTSEEGRIVSGGEPKHIKREFVFPGAPLNPKMTDNGPFHFMEEAMHQCIKRLPAAFEKLRNDEEPDAFEIFTFGTPFNELGVMSDEFLESIKKNPVEAVSDVFTEFIEKNGMAKSNATDKLDIELLGESWGGGTAAITGEKLLETGVFTQDFEKAEQKGLPKVTIRSQNAVSLSRSKIKTPQILLGFPVGELISGMKDKYAPTVGKAIPGFTKQLDIVLGERGIHPNMSKDQQVMKVKGMLAIILALGKGVKLKPETKITEVYGLRDLTTYTPGLIKEAKEQLKSHAGSLGQNLTKSQKENSRVFAVDTFHDLPFFRKNELKRIRRVATDLSNLQRGGKVIK